MTDVPKCTCAFKSQTKALFFESIERIPLPSLPSLSLSPSVLQLFWQQLLSTSVPSTVYLTPALIFTSIFAAHVQRIQKALEMLQGGKKK